MSDKKDKDSYAQNTMEFTAPRPHRTQRRPQQEQYYQQGQYYDDMPPQPHRPQQGQRPQGQRPQGRRSQGQRPQGQRPQGQRPQGQRPQGQRPQGQRPQSYSYPQQRKRRRGHGLAWKIFMTLLMILFVLFLIYSVLALLVIGKVERDETGERIAPSHGLYEDSAVRNILLIGNDSREGDERGRSDSIILFSINRSKNETHLVSLMRDSYVNIPGHGYDKLNAAYAYGGPELLMDTIEENFYIDVDDYISINFTSFAQMVDAVGGVEIEVNDDEAEAVNALLDSPEGQTLFGQPKDSDYLPGEGTYKLSGKQALCYSRLRKVGNADFERTERQRKVLSGIIGNMGPGSLFSVIGSSIPDLHSNMSMLSMYWLSLRAPFIAGFYDFKQLRIPAEGTYTGSDIDGQSVLELDMDANLDIIEDELYNDY